MQTLTREKRATEMLFNLSSNNFAKRARIPLAAGLADTYAWFQENRAGLRA